MYMYATQLSFSVNIANFRHCVKYHAIQNLASSPDSPISSLHMCAMLKSAWGRGYLEPTQSIKVCIPCCSISRVLNAEIVSDIAEENRLPNNTKRLQKTLSTNLNTFDIVYDMISICSVLRE